MAGVRFQPGQGIGEERRPLKTRFPRGARLSELEFKALPADSDSRLLGTMSSLTDRVWERPIDSIPQFGNGHRIWRRNRRWAVAGKRMVNRTF
jgi:hypothetical protein